MSLHSRFLSALLPLFLITISTLTRPSTTAVDSFVYGGCSQLKYKPGTPYESNANSVLTSFVNSAAFAVFNNFKISVPGSSAGDVIYGLFQCRGDVGTPNCRDCVAKAVSQLGVLCPNSAGGALQLDGCFVKYDNTSFLGVEDKTLVMKKCGTSVGFDSDALTRRDALMGYLAAGGQSFRVGGSGDIQGVAQCVQDLSGNECQDCLNEAIGRLKSECGSAAFGDMFLGKCYARYTDRGGHSNGGCTLPQGSNASHEVLTTPSSVTADRAPLDVVDSGGQDDDSCGGGDYQATAAGIHRNDCVAEFPPHHVDVPALTGEINTGTSTDQIRTEERVEDEDEKDFFKFGNTLVGLTFEAAVALMVSSFQPRGNLSLLATWSPSRSTSSPPPPATPSLLTLSASFPIIMVRLAIVLGFTVNLIGWLMFRRGRVAIVFGFTVSLTGWMMLRRGRVTAANFCRFDFGYVTPLEAMRQWRAQKSKWWRFGILGGGSCWWLELVGVQISVGYEAAIRWRLDC
ncbi:hypothetical protein RHGRI_018241 [Rhododendron griersonianum]|uniref:Gnk2-homologous domain-containing protein n=1 Tax=Rhododendron griersonianum TaxID=479676 RepID=A0AAV6K0T7_9ERIC|nr:hypothetical protein RHGRI_018241 [Rhododendron griersonianum]